MRGPRVLVAGAGILGSAVAARLASRGVRVVVASGEYRSSATATSLAWTNANDKLEPDYHRLNLASMAEYRADQAAGVLPWYHESGHLQLARDEDALNRLAARVELLAGLGYRAEIVAPAAAARIDPALRSGTFAGAAWYPEEGFVETGGYRQALLASVHAAGGEVRDGVRVARLAEVRGGVEASLVDGGGASAGTEVADVVVICAGVDSAALLRAFGIDVDLTGAVGYHAITEIGTSGLSTVLHVDAIAARPEGNGRLMIRDAAADPLGPEDAAASLRAALRILDAHLDPAPGSARIDAVRRAARPMPPDGRPMIGWVPGSSRVYAMVMHSGVTLAPVASRHAADEIGGDRVAALEPFRIDRFAQI